MDISIYGVIIVIVVFLPYMLTRLIKPKREIRRRYNKQLSILEYISLTGLMFFSFFDVFGYGYRVLNDTMLYVAIVILTILGIFYYAGHIYYLVKRDIDILEKGFVFPLSMKITRGLIFLVAAIFLFNPYIIFFSVSYIILEIILWRLRK